MQQFWGWYLLLHRFGAKLTIFDQLRIAVCAVCAVCICSVIFDAVYAIFKLVKMFIHFLLLCSFSVFSEVVVKKFRSTSCHCNKNIEGTKFKYLIVKKKVNLSHDLLLLLIYWQLLCCRSICKIKCFAWGFIILYMILLNILNIFLLF